jgi:hypothetical protein
MDIAMFTGLVTGAQVTSYITNIAIVFGGIIAIMLVLSPAFLAKGGFKWVSAKVESLFSGL